MSFPVIHELRGEFSIEFYELKRQLEAAATRDAMAAFEGLLRARRVARGTRMPQIEAHRFTAVEARGGVKRAGALR
jgi:hypothetical protein